MNRDNLKGAFICSSCGETYADIFSLYAGFLGTKEEAEKRLTEKAEEKLNIRIDEAKLNSVRTGTKTGLMYILTGSNTHEIKEKASETLAGRTAIIEVTSLSESEKRQVEGNDFFPDINVLMNRKGKLAAKNRFEVFTEIYKGGMPEYWINEPDRNTFFESYISTYLEKDVSRLINIGRLNDFRKFMMIAALRTAQQLDYTEIGNAVGID